MFGGPLSPTSYELASLGHSIALKLLSEIASNFGSFPPLKFRARRTSKRCTRILMPGGCGPEPMFWILFFCPGDTQTYNYAYVIAILCVYCPECPLFVIISLSCIFSGLYNVFYCSKHALLTRVE